MDKNNRNYPFTFCKEKKPVIMNDTRLKGMILKLFMANKHVFHISNNSCIFVACLCFQLNQ